MRILVTGADGRTAKGQFARQRMPWIEERWDDGYVDSRGRFRVYRPDCPRAYDDGYALRAHVVWWLAHGDVHPDGTNLHHVNEDRLDDRIENLRCMEHGAHVRLHKPKVVRQCLRCGAEFQPGRKPKRKYCSLECYHRTPKSEASRRKHSESLKRAYAEGRR